MNTDIRERAAAYYDLANAQLDDLEFYVTQLSSAKSILELGCGTGRLTVPLSHQVDRVVGVDQSEAMLDLCRRKVEREGLQGKVHLVKNDVTTLVLSETFDLVVAPFRVLQNIDLNIPGFFASISNHLASGGSAIVTSFMPNCEKEQLIDQWSHPKESEVWEKNDGEHVINHSVRLAGVRIDPLTVYPELIYRKYHQSALVEEVILKIPLRVCYPDELLDTIESFGFQVTGRWGGYHGEAYGVGPELVVKFQTA